VLDLAEKKTSFIFAMPPLIMMYLYVFSTIVCPRPLLQQIGRKREREPIFFLKYCFVIGNSIKLQKLILEREIGLVMNNNVKFGNEPIYFGAKFHTIVKFLGKKDCDKFNV
jgi:hypothetical protein